MMRDAGKALVWIPVLKWNGECVLYSAHYIPFSFLFAYIYIPIIFITGFRFSVHGPISGTILLLKTQSATRTQGMSFPSRKVSKPQDKTPTAQ